MKKNKFETLDDFADYLQAEAQFMSEPHKTVFSELAAECRTDRELRSAYPARKHQ